MRELRNVPAPFGLDDLFNLVVCPTAKFGQRRGLTVLDINEIYTAFARECVKTLRSVL
jgi:hypothetical protein